MDNADLLPWPEYSASGIRRKLLRLRSKTEIRFAFRHSDEASFIKYFPAGIESELRQVLSPPFVYVADEPDAVILTAHGQDRSSEIWQLRADLGPDTLVIVWLWDNHLGHVNNLKTALAADVVFFSHAEDQAYLFNPASLVAAHVPACSAQWTKADAAEFSRDMPWQLRKAKLLVNYVDYDFASRREVLHTLRDDVPEADVMLMPSGDRGRYFDKSPRERFDEWASYKATIILPITNDLSTRFFDAMLAGLVTVVADCISDIDRLVPPELQESLGILKLGNYDAESLRGAAIAAVRAFDELGAAGMLARHRFVLEHHMLADRVVGMLDIVGKLISGSIRTEFGEGPYGVGLYPEVA